MNIMSMESIFLVLSGVILFAGILYWMWSHIQLTQKKVQLLENAVFELRGMMTPPGGPPAPSPGPGSASAQVYEDLPDDDWAENGNNEEQNVEVMRSTPLGEIHGSDVIVEREELQPGGSTGGSALESANDYSNSYSDLAPGGYTGGPMTVEHEAENSEDFRELFVSQEAPTPVRTPESLDSMPVKELRRLAEQRGIAGAADMRKKEILAALRKQVQPAGEVAVQKTLDLNIEEVASESGHVEEEILE